jgi:hypothetical protein
MTIRFGEWMRRRAVFVGLVAFVVPGLVLLAARAEPPAASADPASSADPSAEPSAEPKPRDTTLRSLESQPPPAEESTAPTAAEWEGAERVEVFGPLPDTCKAFLVREWLRIHCNNSGSAFAVLSGSKKDVTARLVPLGLRTETGSMTEVPGTITLQLPLRRGDRRVMQLSSTSFSEYSANAWGAPFLTISEQWLDDQPGPWVSVAQAP